VVELKASYFVFENVRGLTVGAHKKFLEEIIGEFGKNGYRVLEDYQVLNAAHHGVPQNRQRLFLLGARRGFPLPEYPEATHEAPKKENGHAGSLFLRSTPTVWDALRDLPEADDYEEATSGLGQGEIQAIHRLQRSLARGCGRSRRLLRTSRV
jgi:DNA (cytosine-5)-methyltransferase 1